MRIVYGRLEEPIFKDFSCFIDSKYVVDLSTVNFAVKKAIKNWNLGKRISKSLAMEILLYYSATRQIDVAKKLTGKRDVVAVVLNEDEFSKIRFEEKDFSANYDLELIKKHYEISEEELKIVGIKKLPMLIQERIALFSALGE